MPNPECPNRMCSYSQTGECFLAEHIKAQAETGAPGATNQWQINIWNNYVYKTITQARQFCLNPAGVDQALRKAQALIHFRLSEEKLLAHPDHTPFLTDPCKFVHLKTAVLRQWQESSPFAHPSLPDIEDLILIDHQEVYHREIIAKLLGLDPNNLGLHDTIYSIPCFNAGYIKRFRNGKIFVSGGSGVLCDLEKKCLDAGRNVDEMNALHRGTSTALKKIYPDLELYPLP